jgi:diacylglycerol kinase (ATP)
MAVGSELQTSGARGLAEPGEVPSRARRVLLVANARASGVGAELVQAAQRELQAAGAGVETRRTEGEEDVEAALGAAGDRRVVLLGGDGSLQLVANLPQRPELALIPAGAANNIARSLGIPRDLRQAARLAVSGRTRPLDLLEARTGEGRRVAVEGVSVGFLAQARSRYAAPNSAAVGEGLRVGLQALRKFRPIPVVLTVDGRSVELSVGQLFVSNTPLYAFGLRVAPAADVRDGRLDAVALSPRGRAGLLALAPRVWRGRHLGSPRVRAWRGERFAIDAGGASPVIADSVNLGSGPVTVTVLPGALQVGAP